MSLSDWSLLFLAIAIVSFGMGRLEAFIFNRKLKRDDSKNVLEFDLGQDDILVVRADTWLSDKVLEELRVRINQRLLQGGRQSMVFERGFHVSVIHRPSSRMSGG